MRPGRSEVHERHFFHFIAPGDTADRWLWHEEHDGAREPTAFIFGWLPQVKGHVLTAGMGALLSRISDR